MVVRAENVSVTKMGMHAPKRINLTMLIDASDEIVEPILVDKLDQVERVAGERLEGKALIIRKGTSPKVKLLKGVLEGLGEAALVAMAGLSYATAFSPLMGVVAALASGALLHSFGATEQAYYRALSGKLHRKFTGEPDWSGMRIYEIQPNSTRAIDSKLLVASDRLTLREDELKRFLRSSVKPMPNTLNVLYFSGHGLGYMKLGFVSPRKLAGAISEPVDLLIMDSCLMSNLEALASLRGKARYVIASEDELDARAIKLNELLGEIKGVSSDEELREALKRGVRAMEGDKLASLSLIDMRAMEKLMKDLDELASLLMRAPRELISKALDKARKLPENRWLYSKVMRFADLGDFLHALRNELKEIEDERLRGALREALDEAIKSYEDAVIVSVGKEHLTGISFAYGKSLLRILKPSLDSYPEEQLPPNWVKLLSRF